MNFSVICIEELIMRKNFQIVCFLSIVFCVAFFSGCVTENNNSDPFQLSELDSVKIQFQLNTLMQKNDNNGIETIEEPSWSHEFFSYSTVEINGTIDHQWNENVYTSFWDYNYWYDTTKKQGNMSITFSDDASKIISLHAKESFTDKNDKTWKYELTAEDISIYESLSTDDSKMYSIRGNNTCTTIKSLSYNEFIPNSHPTFIPGTQSLLNYDCDEYSLFIITIFSSAEE
mgnify:CR=1 FL=1